MNFIFTCLEGFRYVHQFTWVAETDFESQPSGQLGVWWFNPASGLDGHLNNKHRTVGWDEFFWTQDFGNL
jgi:hypothetical protein